MKISNLKELVKLWFSQNVFANISQISQRMSTRMHKLKVALVTFILTVAVAFTACSGNNSESANVTNTVKQPAPAATVDELSSGKKVFEKNCAICHRADGTGGKVTVEGKSLNVEDLTAPKIKAFSDEKMIGYVMNGVEDEGMPAFKGKLSEGEMRDVVKYVRMLQVQ